MFVDKLGNRIHTISEENYSMTILGKPGSGKTYSMYRHIEESVRDGIGVLIVDFSGSYTEYEIERAQLDNSITVDVKNPYKSAVELMAGQTMEEAVENLAKSLYVALEINAVTQKELVLNICEILMSRNRCVTFHDLYDLLGELSETEDDNRYLENIDILRRRLYHMKKNYSLRITYGAVQKVQGITILQFSDYTEEICRTMAQLVLELEWNNNRKKNESEKCLEIVLDEFQLLQIKNTGIEKLVRLGRKHGVGVILLSQYMPYTEDKEIIQLAEHNVYFRPNDKNLISIAKLIELEKYREWVAILKGLKRGEAVLVGSYTVNGNLKVQNKSIIVKVISK